VVFEQLYEDLPDEPELIFLKLEVSFRESCEQAIRDGEYAQGDNFNPREDCLSYMRKTTAAAAELGLDGLNDLHIPRANDFDLSDYQEFRGKIDYYKTAFQIRYARRAKGYSVAFDEKTRTIIKHHLKQLVEIVRKLEIEDWKKESLLNCLNSFSTELDRSRSRYEVFGAVVIEVAGILGSATKELEPVRRFIDSVAGLIWGAHHAEQTQRLPPPRPTKSLPAPRTTSKRGKSMDDDIPF
jgi:hypothetical protein